MCGVGNKLREVEDAGRTEGGGCCAVKALTCSKREANQSHWDQQKEDNKLEMDCPECKKGKLTLKLFSHHNFF